MGYTVVYYYVILKYYSPQQECIKQINQTCIVFYLRVNTYLLLVAICYASFYLIKIQMNHSVYYVYTLYETGEPC